MAHTIVTENNLSPLILVVTWVLFVTSVVCLGARAMTKAAFSRSVSLDDYLIGLALILSGCQSITISIETSNGLGKHLEALSTAQVDVQLKASYASDFLYVLSLYMSQLSLLAFIRDLTSAKLYLQMVYWFGICITSWVVVAVFGIAFQCKIPEPWNYISGSCFNRVVWWDYFEITNLILNVLLIAFPCFIIWRLHTSKIRKLSVSLTFALRIVVIAAILCKLVYWNRPANTVDLTYTYWKPVLCTQIIQCVSIISTCTLYLRPFLETFDSGFLRADDLRRRGNTKSSHQGSYELSRISDGRAGSSTSKAANRMKRGKKKLSSIARGRPVETDNASQSSQAQIFADT